MKFQFISKQGDSLEMARKVASEGHKVNFYCERKKVQDGVLNIVTEPVLNDDTIFVFDDPEYGQQSDKLRRLGHTCIGASVFGSNVELTPPYNRSISSLIDDKLPEGLWVEAWFNGEEWVMGTAALSYRDTRFMPGDLGVSTDFESGVFCYWKRLRPLVFKNTLFKLTSILKRAQYVGPIRYGNELSAGFSIENLNGMLQLVECGRLLADTAKGKLKRLGVSYDYSTTIRVSQPPYPYRRSEFYYVYSCAPTIHASRIKAIQKAQQSADKEKQYRIDAGCQAARLIPQLIKEDTQIGRSEATYSVSNIERCSYTDTSPDRTIYGSNVVGR